MWGKMFKEYVDEKIEKIEQEMEKWIHKEFSGYAGQHPKTDQLLEMLKETNRGGKRIRGLLVLLGYELVSGESSDLILSASVAYELFQTGILIHDDVIDQSDLRRGKETIHKRLSGDHLAISNAICLGDFAIFSSYKALSSLEIREELLVPAIRHFSQTLEHTAFGELLDVNLPQEEKVSEQDILNICYYKTAWYTVIGPLTLGCLLAGASENTLSAINEFGKNIGIAFQLKDDILGLYSEKKTLGKSVISDISEKKMTLLYAYTREHAEANLLSQFEKIYGKPKISQEEYEKIKEVCSTSGALSYTEGVMEAYLNKALQNIDQITNESKFKTLLTEFSYYLVKREK